MNIPTKVTKEQFHADIEPRLSKAKRGYVSKQPLWNIFNYVLYKLHTGCQWEELPIERDAAGHPVMSWQAPRYHFYKWSRDGSLQRLFEEGILTIKDKIDLSEINVDGSHTAAKKGAKASPTKDESKRRPATFWR
jgi:transposase